jgi:hypothetical protein
LGILHCAYFVEMSRRHPNLLSSVNSRCDENITALTGVAYKKLRAIGGGRGRKQQLLPTTLSMPGTASCLLAGEVPCTAIQAFVRSQPRWCGIFVGHPVCCCGVRFAFIGIHAFPGYNAGPRWVSFGIVHFRRIVGLTAFCSHPETSFLLEMPSP